jgi:hypothetical protein
MHLQDDGVQSRQRQFYNHNFAVFFDLIYKHLTYPQRRSVLTYLKEIIFAEGMKGGQNSTRAKSDKTR